MIGNDVVDLTAAARESDWRRKGFLEKVFSAREREMISGAADQHQMVWLLWSMKEAAYKARQRAFSLPQLLNWKSLNCHIKGQDINKTSGEVKADRSRFFTITDLYSEVIHTTAVQHLKTEVENKLLETSSETAKREILETIAQHFSLPVSQLYFQKDPRGVPAIAYEDRVIFDQFSFSDHGRFAAFSLSLRIS